jgi:uroporphyrinogen-III synthase
LPASHRHLPLFAVGVATARRAHAAGFEQVTSADANAEALAVLLAQTCDPLAEPLLLVTGQDQGTALAANLRTRGFRVVRRVVYAAVPAMILPEPVHHVFAAGALSSALFFSADTAKTCVRLLRAARLDHTVATVDALAIGPSTAVALQPLPWRRIRVAAQPNQDAMLALLR